MIIVYLAFFLFITLSSNVYAQDSELAIKDWSIRNDSERIFYKTHGTVIYGHEFGFFKPKGDCDSDILWITYSSANDEVLNFIGKEIVLMIDVDGTQFKIGINMLSADKLTPTTKIMAFTNYLVGEEFIKLLNKGRKVRLQIVEPKALMNQLDIKEDEYSLIGYKASRLKAKEFCNNVK